jgi:hypothetical protein
MMYKFSQPVTLDGEPVTEIDLSGLHMVRTSTNVVGFLRSSL